MCRFIQREEPTRQWLEVFRGGLKSTLGTVANSLWAVARDPEERVLIISATQPLTKSFLREIKRHADGRVFKLLYPELVRDKSLWNDEESSLVVAGKGRTAREPSWKAASIDTGVTGGHYSRIIYDDLVTPENVKTREAAGTVIKQFKALRPLLDTYESPELMIGTPYTDYDLYSWHKREMPGWFHRMQLPLIDENGQCIWPEMFPPERIAEVKALGDELWWAQYMLTPRPPSLQDFKLSHFRYFRWDDEPVQGDWSQVDTAIHPLKMNRMGLQYYLSIDPATGRESGDETALIVVATDSNGSIFVVDVYHGKFNFAETVDLCFQLLSTYPITRTTCEMVGPFAALAPMFEAEMRARNHYFFLEKAPNQNREKNSRIRITLGPTYGASRIYHHQLLRHGPLEQQLLDFPGGRYDDLADALEMAVGLARKYPNGKPASAEVKKQVRSTFGHYKTIGWTREQLEAMTLEQEDEIIAQGTSANGIF